jgi:hypothetical protein
MISLVRFIIVSNNVWQRRMMPDAIYMMEASVEFGGWRARIFRQLIGITFVRLYVISENKNEHEM